MRFCLLVIKNARGNPRNQLTHKREMDVSRGVGIYFQTKNSATLDKKIKYLLRSVSLRWLLLEIDEIALARPPL